MKPNVLFVIPCETTEPRGNSTTALRIKESISKKGYSVEIINSKHLNKHTKNHDVVVAIHAIKSGIKTLEWTTSRKTPYIVLFSGTDLNGKPSAKTKRVIKNASQCVSLSSASMRRAKDIFPECRKKIRTILQAVQPLPNNSSEVSKKIVQGKQDNKKIILIPNGIRKIKNNCNTVKNLDALLKEKPDTLVFFAGYDFGGFYSEEFHHELAQRPWAFYLGALNPYQFRSAIKSSHLVLSASHSEGGAPNSLLEAINLEIPVLASDIPQHRELLRKKNCFSTPKEMRRKIKIVFKEEGESLIEVRKLASETRFKHSLSKEATAWDRMLSQYKN